MRIMDVGGGRFRCDQVIYGRTYHKGPAERAAWGTHTDWEALLEIVPSPGSPHRFRFQAVGPGGKIVGSTQFYRLVWTRWKINLPLPFCFESNGVRANRTAKAQEEYVRDRQALRDARFQVGDLVVRDAREYKITKRVAENGLVKYWGVQRHEGRALRKTSQSLGLGLHYRLKATIKDQNAGQGLT